MIAPPAIERWADRAVVRVIPSLIQNWLIGKIYQEQFVADADPEKKRTRIFSKVSFVRSLVNRMKTAAFVDEAEKYIAGCVGIVPSGSCEGADTPHAATFAAAGSSSRIGWLRNIRVFENQAALGHFLPCVRRSFGEGFQSESCLA